MSGIVHPSSVAPKSTLFRTLQSALALAETAGVARTIFLGIVEPLWRRRRAVFRFSGGSGIANELFVAGIAVSTRRTSNRRGQLEAHP